MLDSVGLDTAGVFKCEVMADSIFETVVKEANMTVIGEFALPTYKIARQSFWRTGYLLSPRSFH